MTIENTVNVPREPTEAMEFAGMHAPFSERRKATTNSLDRQQAIVADIYRAMIDAAPLHEGEGDELRESVARIIDPAAFMFGPGELDDKVYSASRAHAIDRADRILKLIASARSAPPPSVEVERLREALERFLWWGQQQCPCDNDEPNPCPLCGASIENLERCKAVEEKFPRDILTQARAALSRKEQEPSVPTPGGA